MENKLNIALIQTDNVWEDIDQNLKNLSLKIATIANDIDVIILPELFSTGFTMKAEEVAEQMDVKSVVLIKQL